MTRTVRLLVNGVPTVARVNGGGPPLLIVPGLGCASWMYRRLAHALSPHAEVWRYDHPGHGRSGGRAVSIDQLSAHLAAFMRGTRLAGTPLLGHSLGAEIALDVAVHHPGLTPALVLAAPTGIPENPVVALQLLHLLQDGLRERPGLTLLALAAYARCGASGLWTLAQDQRRHDSLPNLERARLPVLVALGDRDPIVPPVAATALKSLLPDPRLCVVHGAAHALMGAGAQELARSAVRFLAGTAGREA